MQAYIARHFADGEFTRAETRNTVCYQNRMGWTDWFVTDRLLFSHRVTAYTHETFRETFHDHTYYELNICRAGEVCFFAGDRIVSLRQGLVYLLRPNTVHTGKLLAPSVYDRYILYFTPDAFAFLTGFRPLLHFTEEQPTFFGLLDARGTGQLFALLEQIEQELQADTPCSNALALADILRLFAVITGSFDRAAPQYTEVPERIRQIRAYIDGNFQTLETVGDIAAHFSYSKEYITRLFTKYYNGHIYNYLTRKKISYGITLLEAGYSITDACYRSGFGNMTSFLRCFREATGTTPSKYLSGLRIDSSRYIE